MDIYLFYSLNYNLILHFFFFNYSSFRYLEPFRLVLMSLSHTSILLFIWVLPLFLAAQYSPDSSCAFPAPTLGSGIFPKWSWLLFLWNDIRTRSGFFLTFGWFPVLDSRPCHYHQRFFIAHISHSYLELSLCSGSQMGFNSTNVSQTRTSYNLRAPCLTLYYCSCWALPRKLGWLLCSCPYLGEYHLVYSCHFFPLSVQNITEFQ